MNWDKILGFKMKMDRKNNETDRIQPLYYTIQNIMDMFGISKSVAYKLANIDDVPCMRIGAKYLFEKEAFDIWRKRNLKRVIEL